MFNIIYYFEKDEDINKIYKELNKLNEKSKKYKNIVELGDLTTDQQKEGLAKPNQDKIVDDDYYTRDC